MRRLLAFATLALPAILAGAGIAPQSMCVVPVFRGMTQLGGTIATMDVANTGASCNIRMWAVADERIPWDEVNLAEPPGDGSVDVSSPPWVGYLPRPGFVGRDRFTLVSRGRTHSGRHITGLVHVLVNVLPP